MQMKNKVKSEKRYYDNVCYQNCSSNVYNNISCAFLVSGCYKKKSNKDTYKSKKKCMSKTITKKRADIFSKERTD